MANPSKVSVMNNDINIRKKTIKIDVNSFTEEYPLKFKFDALKPLGSIFKVNILFIRNKSIYSC